MRVTNLMMTNNALYNLQKQEQRLNKLDEQYNTQKKISRPSDDPIVATRALKLNTTYSEITQYVSKNIKDAQNWMSMTQSALDNVTTITSKIYAECAHGNTDGLSNTDRKAIATTLTELKKQIYQEGTSSYGGRYLFTGYKTDTNLVFTAAEKTVQYTITQPFGSQDISKETAVLNQLKNNQASADKIPEKVEFDRVRLAYGQTDAYDANTFSFTYTDQDGNSHAQGVNRSYDTFDDFLADYESRIAGGDNGLEDTDVCYIADRGELIIGNDVKAALQSSKEFSVTYQKTGFDVDELRPEHYFTCTKVEDKGLATEKTTQYERGEQEIKYLVNYNQQMTVNVQAKDSFTHDMGRDIDELVDIVNAAVAAQEKKQEYENKMNACQEGSADYNTYKALFETASIEYEVKSKIMQESFASNEAAFKEYGVQFSGQATSVGAREQRLDLIKTRLEEQQADVEELQSNNIDVDLSEIIVRFTSAYDVYQAALSATSKSITQTLLDYL